MRFVPAKIILKHNITLSSVVTIIIVVHSDGCVLLKINKQTNSTQYNIWLGTVVGTKKKKRLPREPV